MPDLAPLSLGPLALDGGRALVALSLAVALAVAEVRARRRGGDADWAWGAVAVGLLVARLAYVAAHAGAFLARPLEVLFVWQGGFVSWAGAAAGLGWAAWRLRARGRPVGTALGPAGAGLAAAAALLLVLPTAPAPPALDELEARLASLDGRSVSVAAWGDAPTVVNLWATWCGPCRRELPMLIDELGGRDDVRLALVSQGEAAATVRAYLEAEGLPIDDVWLDREGALGRAVSLVGLPTTAFVAEGGRVVEVAFGEISRARLAEGVARIVAAGGPAAVPRPASEAR